MPKKIIGKSKILSNLQKQNSSQDEHLNLLSFKKSKPILKNFRLSLSDIENLKKIVENVNKETPHRTISETKIIKALIFLASNMPPNKILKSIKEIL
jgi:hypothetical protein